mmetsp:Transcript_76993/g.195425  ORF Transcript_76993/g.195425 Transcript_76993/m.195425 type:complete len:228 (-) Transcript_76993:106-789(-)
MLQRCPGACQHLQGRARLRGEADGAQRPCQSARLPLGDLEDVAVARAALCMAAARGDPPAGLQKDPEHVDLAVSASERHEQAPPAIRPAVRRQASHDDVLGLAVVCAWKHALAEYKGAGLPEADFVSIRATQLLELAIQRQLPELSPQPCNVGELQPCHDAILLGDCHLTGHRYVYQGSSIVLRHVVAIWTLRRGEDDHLHRRQRQATFGKRIARSRIGSTDVPQRP